MNRLPTLKPRKVMKMLKKLGFVKVRQVGSHVFFKHADGRATVVPNHPGHDIGRGLLREILDEVQITPEVFQKLL